MKPPTTMILSLSENQLQQQQQQLQKPIKVTKVRRTRQPKNPQLSVARRNERERNRVKMVNNGFALLREHLPVEDLQACEGSGSDTPTPDGGSVNGGNKSSKAKKFSKVETLRAAIQRIKMLEELIRSTDAEFESMNIQLTPAETMQQVAVRDNHYNLDEEPLSVCEPLSCSSSSLHSGTTTVQVDGNQFHYQHQIYSTNSSQSPIQQEQFIKLEPQQHLNYNNLPLSPQNSQSSRTSGGLKHSRSQQQQQQFSPNTQVHQLHQSQQLSSPISCLPQEQPSHTHLWIQQHQNSFMEQQQYLQHQQHQLDSANWYSQQQQQQQHESPNNQNKSNWFVNHTNSPALESPVESQQQQQQQQQPQIVESPVWFNDSPTQATTITQNSASQPIAFAHHQQHQISLYSQ